MATIPPLKRGDTFSFAVILADINGDPMPIAAATSQVRDECDNLIADLSFTADSVDTNKGVFTAADTSTWPVTGTETAGPLVCDVRFTHANGVIESTQPFNIPVVRGATHA